MMKRFITMVLTTIMLTLSAAVLLADYDNAGGSDYGKDQSITTKNGGYMTDQTGYRIYVVDNTGRIISDVVDIVKTMPSEKHHSIAYCYDTRIGSGYSSKESIKIMSPGMPTPTRWDSKLLSNYEELVTWLRAKGANDRRNINNLVLDNFGRDVYEAFVKADADSLVYLVLEPVMWHALFYREGAAHVPLEYFYGTTYNWLKLYDFEEQFYPSVRKGFTASVDLNGMPNALRLAYDCDDLGLHAVTGNQTVTFATLGNKGLGIALFANPDFKSKEGPFIPDEPVEDGEETVITYDLPFKPDYAVGNSSDEFDVSEAVPSSEKVTTEYSASTFILDSIKVARKTVSQKYLKEIRLYEHIINDDGTEYDAILFNGVLNLKGLVTFDMLAELPRVYYLKSITTACQAFPSSVT